MAHLWSSHHAKSKFASVDIKTTQDVIDACLDANVEETTRSWSKKYKFICGGADLSIKQTE
jgi:hypothetical protein